MCGYELPTNVQNFTQKDFLGGYFFETPSICLSFAVVIAMLVCQSSSVWLDWLLFTASLEVTYFI